ncbi:hypothetical protein [Oceanobacillus salinisoli]|uniref:hypothetical protein n=1 Tax=Oceanobacillus salinisoli TaxID=2678611 RepID=UPI0012E26DB5|nr:hypothetical protein [Oceanobacillus salinisoli]
MKKKMVLIFLVLVIGMMLSACGGGDEEESKDKEKEEASAENKDKEESADADEKNAEVETKDKEKNSDHPDSEEKNEAKVGSRLNPVPFDQTAIVETTMKNTSEPSESYKAKLEISIEEVLRGKKAEAMLTNENQVKQQPDAAGNELVLVKVKGKVVESETEDYALKLSGNDFDFVSNDGNVYHEGDSVKVPDDLQEELYNGAEGTGYVGGFVEVGDNFKIRYEAESGPVFFESE